MSAGGGGGFNSEINVTPMVDIMLVLLIIFMVVTPLLQHGVTVNIPRELNNPEEDPAIIKESSIVVAIPEDGQYYIDKSLIEKNDLKRMIENKLSGKQQSDRIVYIKSGVGVSYGTVVEIINTIRQAGVDQIGLVADKKKGGKSAAPASKPA
jgi:biopolymer transport protein ExbD/biopolymer transport protein TolR